MSVYYVLAPDLGMVKIGYAKSPILRFSKIQSDSPTRLILVAVEEGGKEVEARIHARFARHRARAEWFRHDGDLADYIASLPPFVRAPKRKLTGPLGEWIVRNGHTLTSFAAIIGTTEATLSRVCLGRNIPRRELMVRIWQETNGEVDANALFALRIAAKARAA